MIAMDLLLEKEIKIDSNDKPADYTLGDDNNQDQNQSDNGTDDYTLGDDGDNPAPDTQDAGTDDNTAPDNQDAGTDNGTGDDFTLGDDNGANDNGTGDDFTLGDDNGDGTDTDPNADPNAEPDTGEEDPNADPNADPAAGEEDPNADLGDTEPENPDTQLINKEKEIYANLSPEDLNIKTQELLESFLKLSQSVKDILSNCKKISPIPKIKNAIEFVDEKLEELSNDISHYITDIFARKTYTENATKYNFYLVILSDIQKLLSEIAKNN